MKVLMCYSIFREGFEEIAREHELTFPEKRTFSREEILELIPTYDVLCPLHSMPIDKEIMDAGKQLKLIANYAVGYNNIDIAYAKSKGIAVAITPSTVTAPTANLALGLLLDVSRRISEFDRSFRREGRDMKQNLFSNYGMPVDGTVLGIVGLGRIGKALAERAIACGMRVVYYNRHQLSQEEETKLKVSYLSFEELLQTSDFVSINAPYSSETHHLISEAELKLMKSTSILINTSRGPLVDEKALVKALQEKSILGAGLDVFEFDEKPLAELIEMENVVLTPHIGTQTYECRLKMAREVSNNIVGFFKKDRYISLVNS